MAGLRPALARRLHPGRVRRTAAAASCVRESVQFVISELSDSRSLRQYRLRESGLVAEVRHPMIDTWVLEEIFRARVYEPPAPVAERLRALGRPPRILDLGGHVGYFGLFMLGRFGGASIVSFEPNPENARVLRACIEANELGESWQIVEACAATRDGTVEFDSSFHHGRIASSDHALESKLERAGEAFPFVQGTALLEVRRAEVDTRDVLPFLAQADLVKIDIEGAEWELLADPRVADLQATAIVLEYHPAYASGDRPEATVEATLTRAGYETGAPVRGGDEGMIWGWKPG